MFQHILSVSLAVFAFGAFVLMVFVRPEPCPQCKGQGVRIPTGKPMLGVTRLECSACGIQYDALGHIIRR